MATNHTFFAVKSNTGNRAVIEIDGVIGGWDWESWDRINTGRIIRKALRDLSGVGEIEVLISSPGGDVDEAFQIHDALRDHPAKVITIINGFCASAATIIALAGDERRISKNSLYLIHKCSSRVVGNQHDLEHELESQKTINDVVLDIYRAVNKKSEQDLIDLFDYDNGHGKWITAQEAVDFGFCTEIYNEVSASAKVAMVDKTDFARLQYPDLPEGFEHVEYSVEQPAQPVDEEFLFNRILKRAQEWFAPRMDVSPNINPKSQEEMKKFNLLFPLLALCLVGFADQDYNPDEGVTMKDEDLQKLEAEWKKLSEAKAALEQEKQTLAQEKANLEQSVTTLTAERDNWKAKYENKPAEVPAVNGKDAKLNEQSIEDYVNTSHVYNEIFEENL